MKKISVSVFFLLLFIFPERHVLAQVRNEVPVEILEMQLQGTDQSATQPQERTIKSQDQTQSALPTQQQAASNQYNQPVLNQNNWFIWLWKIGLIVGIAWILVWIFVGWQWAKLKFWNFGWPWPWWFWIPIFWFIPWIVIGWKWWLVWWAWWFWIWWAFPWIFWIIWWVVVFKEAIIWIWRKR